jgi:hypothetical protein
VNRARDKDKLMKTPVRIIGMEDDFGEIGSDQKRATPSE